MRVCAVCVFWAQTSVTLAIITRAVFNAYCIINHRLHTGWQSWRGTKSTVASQPRSIPDRCWWLLNQLWLPRGSCRCVCVCVCVCSVCVCVHGNTWCGIYTWEKCVFIGICDEIAGHSLGPDPVWKVPPLAVEQEVSPPTSPAVTSTARHEVICIWVL